MNFYLSLLFNWVAEINNLNKILIKHKYMFENPFAKNLRGYPRKKENKYILDNNTIKVDDSKNILFNKLSLDKRMDDYEYEKKYIKFVKEMKLNIGNFVEFEPELRKKKKIIKENKFLNKIGFNCILSTKRSDKNPFLSNSYKSTDLNNNLNFNKFLSLQNDFVQNQNSFQIQNSLFPSIILNKNQNSNCTNFDTVPIEEEKLKTIKNTKETEEIEKIKLQHKKENEIKNLCNLNSFRELISRPNLASNQNNGSNSNLNRLSTTGFTARKFLNNKYSNMNNKIKRRSSDFFITNNSNNNQFSNTQNNFRIGVDSKKSSQFFNSSNNSNFLKINSKEANNVKQVRIRPESNRTHFELGIKNNHFKNDFTLNNKSNLRKRYFSKKDNLKIQIDKDINCIHNQNLSNKNISTQSLNFKNIMTTKQTSANFNLSENAIWKINKISTNFKSKETNTDLNQIKNVQIIQTLSPKAEEKIALNKTNNYNKFKQSSTMRKENNTNESYLESSKINNSIYATPKPKRNFSARELFNKLSDRKGHLSKELRAINFHNTSIQRDASVKWYNPTKKVKRKFLIRQINDDKVEDKQDLVLPKHDKREKDIIKSPEDDTADKKIYFIEKNKANMINHINTISRMTDENYKKYGNFLEHKYEFYAQQVDIPEYIFANARYRSKTNSEKIDRRTADIKIIFENTLKVKSRILNVKLKKDGKPAAKN